MGEIKAVSKRIGGHEYIYIERPLRIREKATHISEYLGNKDTVTGKEIEQAKAALYSTWTEKAATISAQYWRKEKGFTYPIDIEEIEKIELMNIRYREIARRLHEKNWDDLNRRFIANYVFESNALEGNSLTLKNVAEVVFEKRIGNAKDLREIYDAQNSYELYLWLLHSREKLGTEFVIKLHSKLMKNIDDRLGYRTVPIMLLGKTTELAEPEKVPKLMEELFVWYKNNEQSIYPLELAFRFHALFEKIHPFCDGNGRVGRFLLNYILLRKRYFPIIIRKSSRNRYLKALDAADRGTYYPLLRFALDNYKKTFRKFFEMYWKHLPKE